MRTREIAAQDCLAHLALQEIKPGLSAKSESELVEAAGNIASSIFHPVGTCKMGQDPAAVVDDRLNVHGLTGLRVIDASIMPTITSGNTATPTVMIGEKGAAYLREDAKAMAQ